MVGRPLELGRGRAWRSTNDWVVLGNIPDPRNRILQQGHHSLGTSRRLRLASWPLSDTSCVSVPVVYRLAVKWHSTRGLWWPHNASRISVNYHNNFSAQIIGLTQADKKPTKADKNSRVVFYDLFACGIWLGRKTTRSFVSILLFGFDSLKKAIISALLITRHVLFMVVDMTVLFFFITCFGRL